MAGWLEVVPFKALHIVGLLPLAGVRVALYDILESPFLSWAEAVCV